jgi:aldehyde:ferredoxin oxidoreductase
LDINIYRKYLGGNALASYFLLKELKLGTDPFSEDNILVFTTSILSGTTIPGATRYTVASKSPLTGTSGEAEAGRYLAVQKNWFLCNCDKVLMLSFAVTFNYI